MDALEKEREIKSDPDYRYERMLEKQQSHPLYVDEMVEPNQDSEDIKAEMYARSLKARESEDRIKERK